MNSSTTIPCGYAALVALFIFTFCIGVHGFSSMRIISRNNLVPTSASFVLHAKEKLVFGGEYCGVSDPLPEGTTMEEALDYLFQEDTRDIIFSLGGERPMSVLETTPEFVNLWRDACDYFGYTREPTTDDPMIQVESSVKFPGLKLITTSASGVFVMANETSGHNEYHAFLVAEQQRTEGLAPAVWIFNKLTGMSKREKGVFVSPSGNARSVIKVVEENDKRLSFSFYVKLDITVEFPSVLMKLLPMSNKKMEEAAGKSIQKAISKDVDLAIQATRAAFPSNDSD